jgi:hypothetical protein
VLPRLSEAADVYEWRSGHGQTLIRFDRSAPDPSGWPTAIMFSQPDLEPWGAGADDVSLNDRGAAAGARVPAAAPRASGSLREVTAGPDGRPIRVRPGRSRALLDLVGRDAELAGNGRLGSPATGAVDLAAVDEVRHPTRRALSGRWQSGSDRALQFAVPPPARHLQDGPARSWYRTPGMGLAYRSQSEGDRRSSRAALRPRIASLVSASKPAASRRSTGSSTPMSKGKSLPRVTCPGPITVTR